MDLLVTTTVSILDPKTKNIFKKVKRRRTVFFIFKKNKI